MSKKKPTKRRVGRPTKYDPKYCEMLIDHMAEGLSFDAFAGRVEVTRETLYEWARVHSEFSDAKKIGFSKCLTMWEELGVKIAKGEIQGQPATWFINMKNRFPKTWRDKHEHVIEHQKPSIIERSNGDQVILDVTPIKELKGKDE